MSAATGLTWHEANQHYLMRAVRETCEALARRASDAEPGSGERASDDATDCAPWPEPAPAIELLCEAFGLSSFERELLLLCAGVELDARVADTVASLQRPARSAPTFGLALAGLREAHWSALTPSGPLRRFRLIEVGAGETLTASPLRIDERVLHYLVGVSHLDERLRGLVEPVAAADELTKDARACASAIASKWRESGVSRAPVVQLRSESQEEVRGAASAACTEIGARLYAVSVPGLPPQPAELDAFIRLWQREAVLDHCALLIEHPGGALDAAHEAAVATLLRQLDGLVITTCHIEKGAPGRPLFDLDLGKPGKAEQQQIWRSSLGNSAARLNGQLDVIGAHFDFEPSEIRLACSAALRGEEAAGSLSEALWEACRAQARNRVDDLAQRIESRATWQDLVLPPAQCDVLREIAVHVRNRLQVYEAWGFGRRSARGLGISALFAGPSGTGKTMAAEVLADELKLDLYRIDLSQIVSKYIGETEKNLRRVFDAAERGCGILLFDEADALFGKRSEVKDSHDRYANVEVSYLLQRMEAYRGLAILTTNMQAALDTAFLRRLRFVVQFPFPDVQQRAQIWRRVFPREAPTEDLDFQQLAKMQIAGGNIYNISLCAAFLAAEEGSSVRMAHLMHAARSEYAKLDRSLTPSEGGRR